MAIVYGVLNQKGGVGKSTTAINLAASEAEDETQTVLLIDFDPQGHTTEGTGLKDFWVQDKTSLYEGIMSLKTIQPGDLIHEAPGEQFLIVPSNFKMMALETDLHNARSRETRLLDLITLLGQSFDVIIIDSPSYFGNLTDNLLRTLGISVPPQLVLPREKSGQLTPESVALLSSGLVVPVQAEQTSVRALDLLIEQVAVVEAELKIKVNLLAMVPNMVQESKLASDILTDFRKVMSEQMLDFSIPKRVVYQEAYKAGQSIFTYWPRDAQKRRDILELRECYRKLRDFLHARGEAYVRQFA